MNNVTNLSLVEGYFEALGKGELDKLGVLFADDVVWHQPGGGALSGTYRGKRALFGLFGKFMHISGGSFHIDKVTSLMGNGDLVTATLHFQAEKTNHKIAMNGVDLMRIENGKIKEVWLFSEDQSAEDAFWG